MYIFVKNTEPIFSKHLENLSCDLDLLINDNLQYAPH